MIFPGQRGEVEEVDDDPFIVPLAMPLVAGPSTLALLLLLSSSQPERIWDWCAALVLAWAGSTVLLTASPFMLRALGKRGLRAIGRLMGMLLVLLATQMLLDGVAAFVRELG
jgi:multiple antibiotic resistance protein